MNTRKGLAKRRFVLLLFQTASWKLQNRDSLLHFFMLTDTPSLFAIFQRAKLKISMLHGAAVSIKQMMKRYPWFETLIVLFEIAAIQIPILQTKFPSIHCGIMVSIAAFGPGYPGSNPGKSN